LVELVDELSGADVLTRESIDLLAGYLEEYERSKSHR
jgi:hypothetical protein